jgi:hypothetical protein
MRMWAALRETYGILGDSAHPIGRILSAQPDLRGLLPRELADRLTVTQEQAQDGILTLASECFPAGSPAPEGESFDSLTILAGTYAAPVELVAGDGTLTTVPKPQGLFPGGM